MDPHEQLQFPGGEASEVRKWLNVTTFEVSGMSKDSKTFKVGRDAKTGEFIPVKKAQQQASKSVVESVPKRGYGDTKKK